MTPESFKQITDAMEFDLNLYFNTMINYRVSNNRVFGFKDIFEMTAYVGASYTLFCKTESIEFTKNDEYKVKEYLCNFYTRNYNIITEDSNKKYIQTKYDELIKGNIEHTQLYLQKIVSLVVR